LKKERKEIPWYIPYTSGKRWRVGGAHPSVFLGWVGGSWPRPPRSHGKKLKNRKKRKLMNFSLS